MGLAAVTPRERYAAAMSRVLAQIQYAYTVSSEPAPHPVWWKRLLKRPYRRVDFNRYVDELRKIPRV